MVGTMHQPRRGPDYGLPTQHTKMIQDTEKIKEVTDEQCPKEVKIQPSVLFLQSKCSDMEAQAEKPSHKRLIWALKTGRYWERQRTHERAFQKSNSSSKEKRPRGSIIGKQPDNQCGYNGKFMEMGTEKLGLGRSRYKRSGLEMEPHHSQGINSDKGVGKR